LVTKRDNEGLYSNMKNKYFFARFWQLTMVLTILTQFLVIFISKTRGLLFKKIFADDFNSPSPITSIFLY
jgi:tetrahydromethanopterin S-methyltransferase subunit E